MAYDEGLTQRVRESLSERMDLTEKRMFGGLCFLLGGNGEVTSVVQRIDTTLIQKTRTEPPGILP